MRVMSTEDKINSICNVTGSDRNSVILALEACNGDLSFAIEILLGGRRRQERMDHGRSITQDNRFIINSESRGGQMQSVIQNPPNRMIKTSARFGLEGGEVSEEENVESNKWGKERNERVSHSESCET